MSLKDQILSDLDDIFLNTDEFADEALYTQDGRLSPFKINVIFEQQDLDEMGMEASRYYCEAKTSDVLNAKAGEYMVIKGVTYKIKEPPRHTQNGISIVELTID